MSFLKRTYVCGSPSPVFVTEGRVHWLVLTYHFLSLALILLFLRGSEVPDIVSQETSLLSVQSEASVLREASPVMTDIDKLVYDTYPLKNQRITVKY